jgi:hypothetical protein
MILRFNMKREPPACTICTRDRGGQPSGGWLCPEHQAMHNRFCSTGTSWAGTFLHAAPETSLMYGGINDEVIIASSQEISPGKKVRIVPVRTIAALEIEPGPGGNVITVRTHGGETFRAAHLRKKSSWKLYDTVRRSMEANRK